MPDSTSFSRTAEREGREMNSDEQRADRWVRLARQRRQDIGNRCGPADARTVPFDTGVMHGPANRTGARRDGWRTARVLAATDHIGRGTRDAR